MKKIIRIAAAAYLMASLVFSMMHAAASDPWSFRQHRNGLLCVELSAAELVVYSPFCNWSDVFLLGVGADDSGVYTFSDGLDSFGEWAI